MSDKPEVQKALESVLDPDLYALCWSGFPYNTALFMQLIRIMRKK